MAGTIGTAMQIAIFGGAALIFRGPECEEQCCPRGRSERRKDRIEVLHDAGLAADHLTVAALEPEHAAAGSGVDVMDSLGAQRFGAIDVIDVVRVAGVDNESPFEAAGELRGVSSTAAAVPS